MTSRLSLALVLLCSLLSASLRAPAMGQAALPAAAPLRIGVGGDYPDGLDGLLVSRGLPHERVFPWELADPAVLSRYEVLLLSCPVATRGDLDTALADWITRGGRAYVEIWPGLQGSAPLPQYVTATDRTPEQSDLVVTDTTHPVTQGLSPSDSIDLFHLTGTFIQGRPPEAMQVLGRFVPPGSVTPYSWGAAAVLARPLGKGLLVYSGAPLSFVCFHRGPTTEPLMMRIIDYLAGGRTAPRLAVAPSEPVAAEEAAPPALPDPGPPPAGFTTLDTEDGPYNVLAKVSLRGKEPGVLLLDGFFADGKPRQACLRLAFSKETVTLSRLTKSGTNQLASAAWRAPAQPSDLLVKRREGAVAVLLGDQLLLSTKTDLPVGGAVALSPRGFSFAEAHCQPVGEPVFGDDFMREASETNPWNPAGGHWYLAGPSAGDTSVNAFYYQGSALASPRVRAQGTAQGAALETALATAGEDWWDDYSCSVATRLDGAGTAGLAVLCRPGGDYVALTADSTSTPDAALRLVRVHGTQQTVLAECRGGLEPTQWYRLAVRAAATGLEAYRDGERVLQCALPVSRGGGIGLLVRGGSARFDDVVVQPSGQPLSAPRQEGSPVAELPPALGPQDSLTWANPAAGWTACTARPSLLWHEGDFGPAVTCRLALGPVTQQAWRRLLLAPAADAPETAWLTATVALAPGASSAQLTTVLPGQKAVRQELPLSPAATLSLQREGAVTKVLWNRTVVATAPATTGLRRLGLEVAGPPVPTPSLQVRGPQVRDYVFGIAPTDWHSSAGTWEVASRWACDSRWSWFAGWGMGDFAVWNKRPVEGDVAMDFYMGVKMEAPGGREVVRCRDLNATLCGDRKDPRSGYSFIMGGDGGARTQLLRNGAVVAECPDLRVPAGYGIHHVWYRIRVARVGESIEMDFEGRPVFRYHDPKPLPGGYVGLWSRDSGVLIPRVTIYE